MSVAHLLVEASERAYAFMIGFLGDRFQILRKQSTSSHHIHLPHTTCPLRPAASPAVACPSRNLSITVTIITIGDLRWSLTAPSLSVATGVPKGVSTSTHTLALSVITQASASTIGGGGCECFGSEGCSGVGWRGLLY